MKIQRSRNLDDSIIQEIVEILDGWSGTLTWETLIEAVDQRMGLNYTRQALHKHERVKMAFISKKQALALRSGHEPKKVDDPVMQAVLDRLERIESENERLKVENNNLLEQFVRWTYNAGTRGLNTELLNQPLPGVNRGQTDRTAAPKRVK